MIADSDEPTRFCSLLERSFNLKHQLSAFCTQCDKYTTTTQTRRVQRLPNVLAVDVHITTDKDRAFWTTQQTVRVRRARAHYLKLRLRLEKKPSLSLRR